MPLLRLAKNTVRYVARHGLGDALKYARDRASESCHEWRLGIRTAGRDCPSEVGIDSPFAVHYYPSDYRSIYKAFSRLRIRPQRDVFLDYGCGMGRVVVVAGTYPFRRVIGIELSPLLVEMANENLRRARSKMKCPDVAVIQADATNYPVPPDVTVAFFYNPFHGPVLTSALAAIRSSLVQSPRPLQLVFKNTMHLETILSEHPWLVKQAEFAACDAEHTIMILEARV